jgi:hypothetical protein
VVFTLPAELRAVALANRRLVYDLLFRAATDTLLELARSRWDALPGITAVLHTWTRQMALHPHLHCIVTGGGLADDDGWFPCNPRFLFPVKVLGALFRGKFLHGLRRAHERGDLRFTGTFAHLADPDALDRLRRKLYATSWVVYAKRLFGGHEAVVKYLGRYTHRVAIGASRLLSVNDEAVVFRTRGDGTCRLSPDEFIRRFLLHVLPHGFRKIRHYGLLAPANVPTRLAVARDLVAGMNRRDRRATPEPAVAQPVHPERCPRCEVGRLRRTTLPPARAPAREAA